ncbi:heparinase [Tamlana nanhaiensis]|uniref:Heparinase n=1 Tax=Neotamlana nanhaiensis TaxID=1382798 RepID=A0A0D7VYD6_9FLAO|nr:heparinase II/III family protein [Tamlana nanhaiensis]KJD31453.1 heparinase [Tamlana nanhaiensis]
MKSLSRIKVLALWVALIVVWSCKNEPKPQRFILKTKGSHPNLILTQEGVVKIKKHLGTIPIFDSSLEIVKKEVDNEIKNGIEVPVPKHYSGGYTHERHKKNYITMQKAGVLFQILNDDVYANYVKQMLFEYAKLYPTLPVHPKTRSYARGKLFWQCLNDSNWLVYTSQAYDCIYNFLSKNEREILEQELFKPFANFISIENPQFFNRVHNHSTWGSVAVGMMALVMDDDTLLNRALYGIKNLKIDPTLKDNDGGFINKHGKAGFFANLEDPFSPDGYYTEGPYYQRYASYPFLVFAQALQNKKPELEVFKFKDSVLIKSVNALLNLSNAKGEFFLLNDAQKGMSYHTSALVSAVDIAYHFGEQNPELLSIAKQQNRVSLNDAGLTVAMGIKAGKEQPFIKKSIELSDGSNGKQGAVGVLRSKDLELVFKYTAHGLSHGHFDKLSFALFDNGEEVVQDYGLARFVNIEQKGGGNYLKENTTFAKQTIAHNTVVQNKVSHFQGAYEIASKHHSNAYVFSADSDAIKVASAKEFNAYSNTKLHRTMALITLEEDTNPIVLDIFRVESSNKNQYDLPLYYLGQIMQTSFKYSKLDTPEVLGTNNGYQHLYKEAIATSNGENIKFNWLHSNRFYTYTALTSKNDNIIMARIGANDPDYNLRNDPCLIIRKKDTENALFLSVLESHGTYSPVSEIANNAYSNLKDIRVLCNNNDYTAVEFTLINNTQKLFIMSNSSSNLNRTHQLTIKSVKYQWEGAYTLINLNT